MAVIKDVYIGLIFKYAVCIPNYIRGSDIPTPDPIQLDFYISLNCYPHGE